MSKKENRDNKILEILQSHPKIHISTLQRITKYSTSTLRRDLISLENKGLIKRSFGEIKLLNQENLELSWGFREDHNQEAKEKIGKIASRFIEDNDAIFIDSSTTSIHILDHLSNLSGIKVITNCLTVANKIQLLPQVSGFISGGN